MSGLERLPHAGLARWIISVAASDASSGRCRAVVPTAHPLASNGRLPASAVIELGAQAAAAVAAETADSPCAGPPGRVVSVREARFEVDSIPTGEELSVSVELVDAAPPLRTYRFEIDGLGSGTVGVWAG